MVSTVNLRKWNKVIIEPPYDHHCSNSKTQNEYDYVSGLSFPSLCCWGWVGGLGGECTFLSPILLFQNTYLSFFFFSSTRFASRFIFSALLLAFLLVRLPLLFYLKTLNVLQ